MLAKLIRHMVYSATLIIRHLDYPKEMDTKKCITMHAQKA